MLKTPAAVTGKQFQDRVIPTLCSGRTLTFLAVTATLLSLLFVGVWQMADSEVEVEAARNRSC